MMAGFNTLPPAMMMAAARARPVSTDGKANSRPVQCPRADGHKLAMDKPNVTSKMKPPMSIVNHDITVCYEYKEASC